MMESGHKNTQSKKLYETVLTSEVGGEVKKEAIMTIIKMAVSEHSHFAFLLNQVDWFSESNLPLLPMLAKVLRAYRGTSRSAPKVIYNMLSGALSIPTVNMPVVDLLVNIILTYKDNIIAVDSLRECYPHKVCPPEMHNTYIDSLLELCKKMPNQRFALLEIVIENLAAFDTEMALGDAFAAKLVYEDEAVLDLAQECGAFELKYDGILAKVIEFMDGFSDKQKQTLLKQFYLIFQKIMMTVTNMKMIQYIAFHLAQASLQNSICFIALLLNTLSETVNQKDGNSKKIYIAALQYLRSYVGRSLVLPERSVRKVYGVLVGVLEGRLGEIQGERFEELNLNQFGEDHATLLYLIETVLYLKWKFPFLTKTQSQLQTHLNLLSLAKQKTHYPIFLDPILSPLSPSPSPSNEPKPKPSPQSFTTVYIDRFLPVFLPKTQKLIQMKLNVQERRMRPAWSMQESTEFMQMGGVLCRKMGSGVGTPLTIQEYSN